MNKKTTVEEWKPMDWSHIKMADMDFAVIEKRVVAHENARQKMRVSDEHYLVSHNDVDIYATAGRSSHSTRGGGVSFSAYAYQLFDIDGNRLEGLEKSLTKSEWDFIHDQVNTQAQGW